MDFFLAWLKARLHIKPHELKGAPGVKDDDHAAAAADVANALVGAKLDEIAAAHGIAPVPVPPVDAAQAAK